MIAELDASVSDPNAAPPRFTARLVNVDNKRVATGRDFDSLGVVRGGREAAEKIIVLDEAAAGVAGHRFTGRQPHRGLGGGEALHPPAVSALHDPPRCSRRRAASCGSPPSAR